MQNDKRTKKSTAERERRVSLRMTQYEEVRNSVETEKRRQQYVECKRKQRVQEGKNKLQKETGSAVVGASVDASVVGNFSSYLYLKCYTIYYLYKIS